MWSKLIATGCLLILLVDNHRSFVDTAPTDNRNATNKEILESWKIYSKNNEFVYFDEAKEKEWNGPFYFVQGADIQFGFISKVLDNKPVIDWEREKILAEAIVRKVNEMRPRPRFFVICGDLCDAFPITDQKMRDDQKVDFKRIFGKVDKEIPLVCVCGNHDVGNTPTHASVNEYRSSFGDDYFSFFCGGLLFLVINSQYFHDPSQVGDLAKDHIKWIDGKLEEAKKKGVKRIIVFQHIPWFLYSIDEEEVPYFTLNAELRKIWLDKFKAAGVEAIFCGHLHKNAGGEYRGMKVVITSAIGGQLGNDKSGARIVHVSEENIDHKYYAIEDLPSKETKKDEEVKELEGLKKMFENVPLSGKQVSVGKVSSSVYSNVNGHKSSHGEMEEEVSQNGKVVAKVSEKVDVAQGENGKPKSKTKVEVNIPSKGIHKTIMKEGRNMEVVDGQDFSNNGQRRSVNTAENGIDKINAYAGLEYTPLDMAEYIFWTGDEKGVIMAIEEFLEEGLMSRDEAINFLQSIKTNLNYMQDHYHGLQKTENRISSNTGSIIRDRLSDTEKPSVFDYDILQENDKMKSDSYDDASGKYEVTVSKPEPYERQSKEMQFSRYENQMKLKNLGDQESLNDRNKRFKDIKTANNGATLSDEDFEDLLERLRVADFLYSEYSLEDIIYQLAKVVFSQSLSRGSTDAQLALQRFTSFLEKEARLGQISRSLEKKIIDLLIAALSDTLTENPQLLAGVRASLNDEEPNLSSSMMKNQMQTNQGKSLPVIRSLDKASVQTSSILQNKVASSKN